MLLKMLKKIYAFVLSALIMMQFSGCAVIGLDAQGLMSPPKANADQQEIHNLLQGEQAETSVTFIYPKNGEYRSAITMVDFTGSGIEDAIGFYLLETGGVEVQFLSRDEGQWATMARFSNSNTQVDRISIGDINGDGVNDVIIGWGNTQNNLSATLCAYIYMNGKINELTYDRSYGSMILTDFDEDGIMEIFLIERPVNPQDENAEQIPAQAELVSVKNGNLTAEHRVEADNSITRYPSILFGKITKEKNGVVMDGAKADSSTATQVFYFDEDGQFVNYPSGMNEENAAGPFWRPPGASAFYSKDINADGIIEIPVVSQLPAISNVSGVVPDSTSFLVSWSVFDEAAGYAVKMNTLMNAAEGYYFKLPYTLNGKITTNNDTNLRAVTYYSVEEPEGEEDIPRIGSQLFVIRVFSQSSWEQRGQPGGYKKLAQQNDNIYAVYVIFNDTKYKYSIDQIQKNFTLITD